MQTEYYSVKLLEILGLLEPQLVCGFVTDILKMIRMLHNRNRNAAITEAILPLLLMLSAVPAIREAGHQKTAETLLQEAITQLTDVPVNMFVVLIHTKKPLQCWALIMAALQSNVDRCYSFITMDQTLQTWLHELSKLASLCKAHNKGVCCD